MGSRFSWLGFSHRQARDERTDRRGVKASRAKPTWIGLEGLEPRLLLAGSLAVYGGTGLTALIANGDVAPIRADGTDFAEAAAGGGDVYRTFSIHNTSAAPIDLTGAQVAISGLNASNFTIAPADMPAGIIAAGGSTNFVIHFDPSAAGLRQASVAITSDDVGGPTYSFNIQGTGLAVTTTGDGLQYAVTTAGAGSTVVAGDNLVVNYTGYLVDGSVFDSSLNPGHSPFSITGIGTASLITGWNEGLIGMQVGETRALIIPASLGYGSSPQTGIPANSTLIFDVTLLSDNSQLQMRGGTYYGYSIADTQQTTNVTDHTDFGKIVLGGSASWNFALANFATASVNLLGTPTVVISGANAADFTVTAQAPATIAADSTANGPGWGQFTVHFAPSVLGTESAVVTLLTGDPRQGSYSFTVQGSGAPDHLTGATENQPFTVSYAAVYQAIYRTAPPVSGAPVFQIQSVDSGTLTISGIAVLAGSTQISSGQSLVWTPALNASQTRPAFTVQTVSGSQVTGSLLPIVVEVAPVSQAPVFSGTLANVVMQPAITAQNKTVNLAGLFADPDVSGPVVRFVTAQGTFYVATFTNTPTTAANFLGYVTAGAYNGTIINSVTAGSLIEAGGYSFNTSGQVQYLTANSPVGMEYTGYSNAAGTLSVWRSPWAANGNTTDFAFNVSDNSAARDGDYAVIGRVIGSGMTVLNAIAAIPAVDYSASLNADFASVPVLSGNPVLIGGVSEVPAITLSATSSNTSLVTASVSGSTLTLNFPANVTGSATITVTATDVNGLTTTRTFTATDQAVATVTGVSATVSSGAYSVPAVIPITVAFSRAVTVSGTPTLALNSGGTAVYASGSGTTTLTFNYTISAGQTSARLDYSSTTALALGGGGSIQDALGRSAKLTLASPGSSDSLGFNKNIVIDSGIVSLAGVFGTIWSLPGSLIATTPLSGKVSVAVSNLGSGALPAGQTVTINFVAHDTTNPANPDVPLLTLADQSISALAPGRSQTFTGTASLPAGLPADRYQILANMALPVGESNSASNAVTATATKLTKTLAVAPSFVDLAGVLGINWTLPFSVRAGKPLVGTVSVVVKNLSNVALPTGQQVNIEFVARDLTHPANADITLVTLSNLSVSGLAAGGTRTFSAAVSLPAGLPADHYEIVANIVPVQPLAESSLANNLVTLTAAGLSKTVFAF